MRTPRVAEPPAGSPYPQGCRSAFARCLSRGEQDEPAGRERARGREITLPRALDVLVAQNRSVEAADALVAVHALVGRSATSVTVASVLDTEYFPSFPRIRSERPAFDMHYPQFAGKLTRGSTEVNAP